MGMDHVSGILYCKSKAESVKWLLFQRLFHSCLAPLWQCHFQLLSRNNIPLLKRRQSMQHLHNKASIDSLSLTHDKKAVSHATFFFLCLPTNHVLFDQRLVQRVSLLPIVYWDVNPSTKVKQWWDVTLAMEWYLTWLPCSTMRQVMDFTLGWRDSVLVLCIQVISGWDGILRKSDTDWHIVHVMMLHNRTWNLDDVQQALEHKKSLTLLDHTRIRHDNGMARWANNWLFQYFMTWIWLWMRNDSFNDWLPTGYWVRRG